MKTWKETIEYLRERITELDPDWNDYNLHDPGITILEMLAWMQQNQIYHAEQIGEEQRRKYAKLLGISRFDRRPGRALVTIGADSPRYLEKGSRFYADTICFETREGQMVAEGVFKQLKALSGEEESILEGEWIREGRGISFYPFGKNPAVGNWFELTFSQELEPGVRHRLFLKVGAAFEKHDSRRDNPVDEEAYDGHGYYPLAEIRIEYQTENGWQEAVMERDETYAMVQEGSICFSLEFPMKRGDYRLRFLLVRCGYLWGPCITRISLAMVEAWQQETRKEPLEFWGRGLPRQCFDCEIRDLWQEKLVLETSDEENPRQMTLWTQVDDFDSSGPEDRHYRVEDGRICFGDGFAGRMPEGRIRLSGIVRTLGSGGNVKAGAIYVMEETGGGEADIPVTNEEDVVGGRDMEPVEDALLRFASGEGRKKRAVTLADYEELVMDIPGLRLEDCTAYCGAPENREITLVVKPETDTGQGELNEAYRRNLYRYLEEKRMLGTRLVIHSPVYCPVTILCICIARPQYRQAGKLVETWIREWMKGRGFGQGISFGELSGSIEALPCIQEVRTLGITNGRQGRRNARGDLLLPPDGLMILRQVECQVMIGMGQEI